MSTIKIVPKFKVGDLVTNKYELYYAPGRLGAGIVLEVRVRKYPDLGDRNVDYLVHWVNGSVAITGTTVTTTSASSTRTSSSPNDSSYQGPMYKKIIGDGWAPSMWHNETILELIEVAS